MKKFLTPLLMMLMSLPMISMAQQEKPTITGVIADASDKSVPSATISLLIAKDSVLYQTQVTDEQGKFTFQQVPSGSYLISVSAVGHDNATIPVFHYDGKNQLHFKTIQ